jgi:hypothetical protein
LSEELIDQGLRHPTEGEAITIQIHTIVVADGHQLRRLAANAVIFELERRMDGATFHRVDLDGQHVLILRVLLDRIGGEATEPIVRARVLVAVGEEEPHTVEHFDVRLRDWLSLRVPGLGHGEYDQVGPARRVDVDHLVPDEHSPGGPDWIW